MHSYSAGSSSQHLPKIESIPMAHQWNPKESIQTVALGLITMISVYKKVWNIDLSKWFSAVTLDDHAARQASIEIILPHTLLGQPLAHLEQDIVNKISGADVTRSKRRGRWRKPRQQQSTGRRHLTDALPASTSAIRNQSDTPEGTTSAVCIQDNTSPKPAQQDGPPSSHRSQASIQAAYTKANL